MDDIIDSRLVLCNIDEKKNSPILGSNWQKSDNDSTVMSEGLATFQLKTVLGNRAIGPIATMPLLNLKPAYEHPYNTKNWIE